MTKDEKLKALVDSIKPPENVPDSLLPVPEQDRNCLSYWFFKLKAAGVPVPRTEIVLMDDACRAHIWAAFDGKNIPGRDAFMEKFGAACDRMGYPCFIRTGQFSGKHRWKDCCYLERREDLEQHVYNLAEFSEIVDFLGLPWHVWVARELLPTQPICTLPAYGGFPLVPEVRCFVGGGKVLCAHGYWPEGSIKEGFQVIPRNDWLSDLDDTRDLPGNFDEIVRQCQNVTQSGVLDPASYWPLAQKIAEAFAGDGEWSIDLLPTTRGWYCTDCAVAERSYHDQDCNRLTQPSV